MFVHLELYKNWIAIKRGPIHVSWNVAGFFWFISKQLSNSSNICILDFVPQVG